MVVKNLISTLPLVVVLVSSGLALASPQGGALPPMDFQHWAILDPVGDFYMFWTPEEKDIVIEIQVATRGYIGLGFSPNGGMKGADIVLGWVDDTGKVHAHDRHALGMLTPLIDDSQDVEILGGYENDTHTVLRFSRPWNTCDKDHDFQLSSDTIRVIWSYSDEDPITEYVMKKHIHRGTKSIYLQEPRFSLPQFGDDVWTWETRLNNVSLSGEVDTVYMCQIFKAPPLRQKTHVIGYVPIIEEQNREHVHHMLLYECHVPESARHYEQWVGVQPRQCFTANMPLSWANCRSPIITWAIGSEGEIFPEHVGFPLGEEHGGATYFMIEMHYDNPNFKQGVVDSSGLRVFLTEHLREFDAGFLVLGHEVDGTHIIPPGRYWKTIGHCDSDCLLQGLPREGIKVFQALLHTHLLGTDITVRQIRNGRELPLLLKDMNYDFNYQQARVLQEEMSILPGDSFITECGYDSTKEKSPTFGGEGTNEEMCLAFLMYYPRSAISGCSSAPEMSQIYTSFGVDEIFDKRSSAMSLDSRERARQIAKEHENIDIKNKNQNKAVTIDFTKVFKNYIIKAPKDMMNVSLYDVIHNPKTWRDENMVSTLQEQIASGPHKLLCTDMAQNMLEGYPRTYHYPDFLAVENLDEECEVKHDAEAYVTVPPKGQDQVAEEMLKTKMKEGNNGGNFVHFSYAVVLLCLSAIAVY